MEHRSTWRDQNEQTYRRGYSSEGNDHTLVLIIGIKIVLLC